jgi:membrane-associated phospholipid phosphatase
MVFFSLLISTKRSVAMIKTKDESFARLVSHVISPHVVGIVLITIMAFQYSDNPWETLGWLVLLLPLIVLPPFLYVIWLVHTGMLEDIYMPRRETRTRPLAVMISWIIICLGLIRYWRAPVVVEAMLVIALVLAGVLSVVTLFWKISFHGAAISAAAMTTMMTAGSWTWPVMLLVPLVGWSRVRLTRHTPRQVIYGSMVGALMALVLVYGILLRVV